MSSGPGSGDEDLLHPERSRGSPWGRERQFAGRSKYLFKRHDDGIPLAILSEQSVKMAFLFVPSGHVRCVPCPDRNGAAGMVGLQNEKTTFCG